MGIVITEENRLAAVADNIVYREVEIFHYQMNIDNYSAIIASLPGGVWPEGLSIFKDSQIADLPVDMPEDDVALINRYQYRDRLMKLIRTEKAEQEKSSMVLAVLKTQLPSDRYDELVSAASIRAGNK